MARFNPVEKAPAIAWRQCWAKTTTDGRPGMSVHEHCRIVGHVAAALLEYLPVSLRIRLGDNPALIAALHDVGKISPGFQLKYFRAALAELGHALAKRYQSFEENHAAVSELTVADVYGNPVIAQVAGSHHGCRQNNHGQKSDREYQDEDPEWPRQRRLLVQALENEFGPPGCLPRGRQAAILLAGLTCVADWIASDEQFFSPSPLAPDVNLSLAAAQAVRRCGWRHTEVKPNLSFEDIFGFPPYPMQQAMLDQVAKPGVYILEAPTGMGKTEAALYAAYSLIRTKLAGGLYFGLPTRLTSDRIHLRVNEFLESVSSDSTARLAHGTAWLARFDTQGDSQKISGTEADLAAWFNPLKRALLCPFAVGTIDQALLGVLNVRHFFLRLFGLAGKVVILDEVHSYDMFTGTHLDELVKVLRDLECTVIILSATLTTARRETLLGAPLPSDQTGYPLLTSAAGAALSATAFPPPPVRQVGVRFHNWPAAEVAATAVGQALAGVCVLCIANTVAQAQEWYCAIKAEMPENAFPAALLHSKFIGRHRTATEDFWMEKLGKNGERPNGCILVATQVVEQSVDIDADLLITELAPTDMLVQRLGRLWRHPRENRPLSEPRVVIVAQDLPPDADVDTLRETLHIPNTCVYSPYVLCRSYEAWKRFDGQSVELPSAVRSLLEDTYREKSAEPPAWNILRDLQNRQCEKLTRCAAAMQAGSAGMPVMRDDEHAATRYNDRPSRTVLLAKSVSEAAAGVSVELLSGKTVTLPKFGWNAQAAAELHASTLSVAAYQLPEGKTPPWLAKALDSDALLSVVDEDGRLLFDGVPANLAYDESRGLTKTASTAKAFRRLDETHTPYTDYETEEYPDESCDW